MSQYGMSDYLVVDSSNHFKRTPPDFKRNPPNCDFLRGKQDISSLICPFAYTIQAISQEKLRVPQLVLHHSQIAQAVYKLKMYQLLLQTNYNMFLEQQTFCKKYCCCEAHQFPLSNLDKVIKFFNDTQVELSYIIATLESKKYEFTLLDWLKLKWNKLFKKV